MARPGGWFETTSRKPGLLPITPGSVSRRQLSDLAKPAVNFVSAGMPRILHGSFSWVVHEESRMGVIVLALTSISGAHFTIDQERR